MTKPAYSQCKIYYDGRREVVIGHYLKTPGGSAYRVQAVRQSRVRPYRKNLTCLRWPVDEIPAGAVVHPLYWYSRKKRIASLAQLAARAA